jgi:hypothetical protein
VTIEDITPRITYTGSGTTGPFAVPFYFLADEYLVVVLLNEADQEEDLVLETDYTVTGAGDEEGGAVTLVVAIDDPTRIRITRATPAEQLSNWGRNDPFPAVATETALDRLTMILQEIQAGLDDANTLIEVLELEGVDLFAEHIIEGFDAIFRRIDARNTGSTSAWRIEVDADGHYVLANQSGTFGRLKLNIAGSVDLGDVTYRQPINAQTGVSYSVAATDKSKRITCANAAAITVTIPESLGLAAGDFFDIQQTDAGVVSIEVSGAATVTAPGGTANTVRRGDTIRVRCTATNAYRLDGEYDRQRATEKVVTLTSASGVVTIDWSLGNLFKLALTENVTSIVHSNLPASPRGQSILLQVTQHASAAKTVTGWAAGTVFFDGTYVASTGLSAVDEIGLTHYGTGTQVVGKYAKTAA